MRKKKVPLRKCIVCQQSSAKKELIRVVRTPESRVELDPTGKKNGRGAYICGRLEGFDRAVKMRAFDRALNMHLDAETLENLRAAFEEIAPRYAGSPCGAENDDPS